MPSNTAVWLPGKRGRLEIGPAPYTLPRPGEIVVRNHAVAINPVDWLTLSIGDVIFPWIKYPFVLGSDVAGEVVEVGEGVSRLKVGDRVLGHAVGLDKARNSPAEGAFQNYTVLLAHMTSPVPDRMAYTSAAVLPLGLSTAACGLFQKRQLGLGPPSADAEPADKTVLVWGGSTSVGSNAIQLAKAAGYQVFTTASPKNFDLCKRLGAEKVFDYRSRAVVADIIAVLSGRRLAGALAIGLGSAGPCLDIVSACPGDKALSIASQSVSFDDAPEGAARIAWLLPKVTRLMASNAVMMLKARRRGVRTGFIFGSSLLADDVGPLIYEDFLPGALAEGRYIAAPEPLIVGQGLAEVPAALDVQKRGVSARKVVVSL